MRFTMKLRHVWRTINDGNEDVKVLALQQWVEADGDDGDDICEAGGYWVDVEICSFA